MQSQSLVVTRISDGATMPFETLHRNRSIIVDFWNIRCQRCPKSLAELDALAASATDGKGYIACALSIGKASDDTTFAHVKDLVDTFPHLEHYFMSYDEKEAAKRCFQFTTLPFQIRLNETSSFEDV